MRKILISLIMLLSVQSILYGATSADVEVYVRKDIYELQMQTMNEKLDMILQKLDKHEEKLDKHEVSLKELSTAVTRLSERIDGNASALSARIDGLDARVGDLRNDIYLWLVILGIVIALPYVQKTLQGYAESRKPELTIEDVKRLIEESRLAGK